MKTTGKVSLLDAVPVPAEQVVATEDGGGHIVLACPRFRKGWMQRWLLPKGMPADIRVTLEEHGTAVWRLIDGRRTVREITALLAGHFEEDTEYASRVAAYFVQLQKDGFVRLLKQEE